MPRRALWSALALLTLVLPLYSQSTETRAQTLARMGVKPWHTRGLLGKGVKVAILDSGFRGYRAYLGSALPKTVLTRSFRKDGNLEAKKSQHGILCAEVVHALAPQAQLLLANWEPNHPVQFLQALKWARHHGAKILSCSISISTLSDAEGGGPVHKELTRLLSQGKDEALFFACAGNTAERHWGGDFNAGTYGYHDWGNRAIDNQVIPWGSDDVSVELCGAKGMDFELLVYDATTRTLLGRARAEASSIHRCAVIRFRPKEDHTYYARVRRVNGNRGRFHLFVLGGSLKTTRSRGSIPFPGDGKSVVTIGAVDTRLSRMSYSSCGMGSSRAKPSFVAMVPFQSSWRERPFTGTSAAAPQAAGLAALLWSGFPKWDAKKVRSILKQSALDLGNDGHDPETGHGLVRIPGLR